MSYIVEPGRPIGSISLNHWSAAVKAGGTQSHEPRVSSLVSMVLNYPAWPILPLRLESAVLSVLLGRLWYTFEESLPLPHSHLARTSRGKWYPTMVVSQLRGGDYWNSSL